MSAFSTTLSHFCAGNIGLPQLLAVLRDDLHQDRHALFDHAALIESVWRAGRIDRAAYEALREAIVETPSIPPPSYSSVPSEWPEIRATRDERGTDSIPLTSGAERTLLRTPTGPRNTSTTDNSWPARRNGGGSTDAPAWSSEPAAEVSPGTVLKDRFVLEEVIGRGGMGTVYKAKDIRKEEAQDRFPFVAVKILNEDFRRHPGSFKALQREAKKAQSLAHPNVASVFDFDRDGAVVFLVMELLEGHSIETLIRNRAGRGMPQAETLRIVRCLGAALAYAHQKGMVHSDFKPANAFRTQDGAIKVLDFGIARAIARPSHINAETTRFDVSGLGALTPAYASCEMLIGEQPQPSDDVFALACVTYELLSGRHPFGHVSALLAERRGLKPMPIQGLDRRCWRALARGLAFSRKERTRSVDEFLAELTPRSHTGLVIAAAAAGVVAVGVGTWWYLSVDRPRDSHPMANVEGVGAVVEPVAPAAASAVATPSVVAPVATVAARPAIPDLKPTAPSVAQAASTPVASAEVRPSTPQQSTSSKPLAFSVGQLQQRLLAFAQMDEVPDALEVFRELQGRDDASAEFMQSGAPRAIAQAYLRLGERAFLAGNYSSAVALLTRAHDLVPELPAFSTRREQMQQVVTLDQALAQASDLKVDALRMQLEAIRAAEGPQFSAIRSRLAETLARRIEAEQALAPARANRWLDIGTAVFAGTSAMAALTPVQEPIRTLEQPSASENAEPRVVTASP